MFEIDKSAFGEFLARQRKEKGYTQKELAEKLFVSDKAVSKWERAQSMPDISLLIPLAEILEVSVSELLEGRKLGSTSTMDAQQVESLVKKALNFSEESPEKKKEKRRKKLILFGSCSLCAVVEMIVGMWCSAKMDTGVLGVNLLTMEAMSFGFGIYFWFFMKERLPAYYDENKINSYSDGVFRMNVPGISFNNRNWSHIIKRLRMWSLVSMIILPTAFLVLVLTGEAFWNTFLPYGILLCLYLGGLFLPVYAAAKKYS